MTANLRGTLESFKKLRSFVDDEAAKLNAAISAATTEVPAAFKDAHATVGTIRSGVKDITDFVAELKQSNGGDPLDSYTDASPRSSDVAQR